MTSEQTAAERPALPRGRSRMTPVLILATGAFVFMLIFYGVSNTFNLILINPLINFLILLDWVLLGEFGLAIIMFTILLRLVTLPLTISFFRSSKNMQAAQPLMQEIQKKYAKDPKRQREEMGKVYKEYGINPLGCLLPFAIQILFFGALYRALTYTVGGSPESLIGLSQRLYDIPLLQESIPLDQHFLWLDLGQPDSTLILPILVFVTTYVQQKLSTPANPTPQQAQQQAMMTWMMPLIITMFMLNLASGVGLYWVTTNIISIFTGYYVYGRSFDWRKLLPSMPQPAPAPSAQGKAQRDGKQPAKDAAPATEIATDGTEPLPAAPEERVGTRHGKRRGKRKNRR
jgi:YidC/Oxa1 family membrane protein insertase